MNRVTFVAVLLLALGCAPPRQRGDDLAVLLATAPTASVRARVAGEFDSWLAQSLRTPGATFRLLQAGPDRTRGALLFAAGIPPSWGAPNAVARREHFVAAARQQLAQALRSGGAVNPATVVSGPAPHLTTLPELDSRGVRWTWVAPSQRTHAAFICDVSPSAAGVSCTADSLRRAYDAWAPGALAAGSTLRIWIVGTSIATASCVVAVDTPELPIADRAAYLLGARNELPALFDHLPAHAGSAVAEAVTVAVTDLASREGAKELRVLSDLRQTSGPWTFDRHVPAAREFVQWLATERLLPDCSEIAVFVCGLHFGGTPTYPPFTARQGALVRELWTQAFDAMHARLERICSECDATAFGPFGGTVMAPRIHKHEPKHTAQIGTNRGGRAFVAAAPADAAEMVRSWTLIDAKPGRAADLAAALQQRFPSIHTLAREGDGRSALADLDERAVVIGTVDTVGATRALVRTRQPQQALCFQLVGRGPGPAVAATRLGLSGIVQTEATAREAGLLLDGFATIAEAASSRALTAAGDPMSAALLHPMRLATTKVTARYFQQALHEDASIAAPLTFFTASGAHPLVVRPSPGEAFRMQRAVALEAAAHVATQRVGIVAAVALVDLEERTIDIFFINRSREDRRNVEGIVAFRAPAQRFTAPAIFTD